jgi:hypothetical protein
MRPNLPIQLKSRLILLIIGITISTFLYSCSTQKNVIQWNVELNESDLPITNRCDPNQKLTSIKSAEQPKLIPASEEREARVRVEGIPCAEKEEPPIYEIPINRVKRVTYVSDPLEPPKELASNDLAPIDGCCRIRDGWWIFDKLEIRGAIGYRGTKDSVVYPSANGSTVYNSKFLGFDRGGSSLVLGLELAGMWDLLFIDKAHHLQGGFILGAWPVDESIFIPLGLNLRYTFNQFPAKFSDNCNSWYIYGNSGLPLDFKSKAPMFGKDMKSQRLFYGIGIGYDWAINCNVDFSIDLGYRYMNLPLPEITCCPGIPDGERNPYRASNVLLLRFGITY